MSIIHRYSMSRDEDYNVLLHIDDGVSLRYESICYVGARSVAFLTPHGEFVRVEVELPEHTMTKSIEAFEERQLKQSLSRAELQGAPLVKLGKIRIKYSDIVMVRSSEQDDGQGVDLFLGPFLTARHVPDVTSSEVQQALLNFEVAHLSKTAIRV